MLSLESIGKAQNTTTITLRGQEVPVKGLSALDVLTLESLWDRPVPPMIPDPTKGDLAPKVTDPADPVYVAQFGQWHARITIAHAAIAVDWVTADSVHWREVRSDPDLARAWAARAIDEMGDAELTRADIEKITDAFDQIENGNDEDSARKN